MNSGLFLDDGNIASIVPGAFSTEYKLWFGRKRRPFSHYKEVVVRTPLELDSQLIRTLGANRKWQRG
jgi:hypothetical protein